MAQSVFQSNAFQTNAFQVATADALAALYAVAVVIVQSLVATGMADKLVFVLQQLEAKPSLFASQAAAIQAVKASGVEALP